MGFETQLMGRGPSLEATEIWSRVYSIKAHEIKTIKIVNISKHIFPHKGL